MGLRLLFLAFWLGGLAFADTPANDTKGSTELFGKPRFGTGGAPTEKGRPYAPKRTPVPARQGEGPGACAPDEISVEAVKKIWSPPSGRCEAAVIAGHCIWENIERAWLQVKHDPKRYCRSKRHLGLVLKGGLERIGIPLPEVYAFFPEWMFEDRSPSDPVLLILPCGNDTRRKPEPTAPVLRMMKAVNCK